MIRAERIEKIKSLAKGRDIITWEELQDCLQVSKATVQRDANILCNASVLRKTRGGVIFIQEPDAHELSNATREVTNKEAKRRTAEAALEFVPRDSFGDDGLRLHGAGAGAADPAGDAHDRHHVFAVHGDCVGQQAQY